MPEYPLILIVLSAAALLLHKTFKVKLFASKRHMFIFYLIFIAIGIVWDQYAVYRGHWSYKSEYLTGINIGYMPLDDLIFGFVVTYFGLVLYKISEKYIK